jgi:transposase-like protein
MGRRGYPPEFRRKVLDLVEAGRKVADVARDLGISDQAIYTWRRQDTGCWTLGDGLDGCVQRQAATAA